MDSKMPSNLCSVLTAAVLAGCTTSATNVNADPFTGPDAPVGAARAQASKELPILLTLSADKPDYSIGETIRLTVRLANPTASPVTFYDDAGEWKRPTFIPIGEEADAEFQKNFPGSVKFYLPDGNVEYMVFEITPSLSENTLEAQFVTIPEGESIEHVITMAAKRPGKWEVWADLHSFQNYLVTAHSFIGGMWYSPATTEEANAKQKAEYIEGMGAKGWHWNRSARCFQKTDLRAALGHLHASTILLVKDAPSSTANTRVQTESEEPIR